MGFFLVLFSFKFYTSRVMEWLYVFNYGKVWKKLSVLIETLMQGLPYVKELICEFG